MKIKKGQVEWIAFLVVYLIAIYLWTLPFQDNPVPYGEFDAISHWELGDYIAQTDRTFVSLPGFLDYSYGKDNKFKPSTLWYHPPFHTDFAIISAFTNDRVIPIFLTNAIFATAILFSVFFVVRKLFGFLPAILSAFLLTFSLRDIMPYLWGQWPERFGYAFIPIILYCFYMYFTTYSKNESKPIYLYLMGILLGIELMIHPLSFFHSLVILFVLGVFLAIKNKKIPINFKHVSIAILLFVLLFSLFPYQSGNVLVSFFKSSDSDEEKKSVSFARIFQWSPNPELFRGSVPENYFSFSAMHGMWTLPFLLLGILALVVRRENRDLFLLAWLIGLYIILHRDLFGKFTFLHRSLSSTAHIFIPITALGMISLASFLKVSKQAKQFLKYGAAFVFVVLTLMYSAPQAHSSLESAYDSPIVRLNTAQVDVSEWLKDTIPEDQNVSIIGPPSQIMQKVWWMASFSHRTSFFYEGFLTWKTFAENREETIQYHLENDYIVFDYSDIGRLQDQSLAQQWQAYEQQTMGGHKLVYNQGNIRVYRFEG